MRLIGRTIAALAMLAPLGATAAEIRIISPGVISNSGLSDVAAAFEKQTGVKVVIQVAGMVTILKDIREGTPAADVVMLPIDLMGTFALSGGLGIDGTFFPLGRVEIGLFQKPASSDSSGPRPDISTVPALAAAMKTASTLFYTDPATGSMQAGMAAALLSRPDFAGIKSQGIKGDAEPALKRGDGDAHAMGLGLIHGPHAPDNKPTGNPYLVGMLPAELNMHMDMATTIPVRARNRLDAAKFILFATSPAMRVVWKEKGVDRY